MSTTAPCSCYCWGPVHIHPHSESIGNDLWGIAQAVMGIPGLLGEVIASQDTKVQPLTQRVVDHLCLRLMGLMAIGAAVILTLASVVVVVVEKIFDKIDGLRGVKASVEQFGRALKEQEQIIEQFGPILELSDKVAAISTIVKQKTEELKEDTRQLDELEIQYPSHAELLNKVSDMLARLETDVKNKVSAVPASNLTLRVDLLKKIDQEEQKIKHVTSRLIATMERVCKKSEEFQELVAQTTLSTQVKGGLIAGLQADVDSLVKQETLIQKMKVGHGGTSQTVC